MLTDGSHELESLIGVKCTRIELFHITRPLRQRCFQADETSSNNWRWRVSLSIIGVFLLEVMVRLTLTLFTHPKLSKALEIENSERGEQALSSIEVYPEHYVLVDIMHWHVHC